MISSHFEKFEDKMKGIGDNVFSSIILLIIISTNQGNANLWQVKPKQFYGIQQWYVTIAVYYQYIKTTVDGE